MDLPRLIDALAQPAAYPYPVEEVEVRHTHISVVFLAGPFVYKIKKPVDLGFLDFSSLEKRRHYCGEEVRLNRRLAPSVYIDVAPIASEGGGLRVEGAGPVVEWAVKMQRLPAEASLSERLRRGDVPASWLEALARRLVGFHAQAEANPRIAAFGRFDIVARNARENFEQADRHLDLTVSPAVFARFRALTEESLERLQPLIAARAARGVPRDTHGDLHLDHVYVFPERPPPGDLVIVDCIEFNERFRFGDPVADMAFLVMDLHFHGRRDLARGFADAYFAAAGDAEGCALLPFYTAYRAAVRAKVEGFELQEQEIPESERNAARQRARAHWLLGLGELEEPRRRPCLLLVGGLPGTGKSTLSRALAEHAGFTVLRTDVVRKELAGMSESARLDASHYSPDWNERTYAECLRRAETLVDAGQRVLVDASFIEEKRRQAFLQAGIHWGVPVLFLVCRAADEVVRDRLRHRQHDASDADWAIHVSAAQRWEEPGAFTRSRLREIATDGASALAQARAALREWQLESVPAAVT